MSPGYRVKPSLSWDDQVALMVSRGLAVADRADCAAFLAATNYYRFSGYARYFQQAPHLGQNDFRNGTAFDDIRVVYEADQALRHALVEPLACVELLLRAHTAYVIAHEHGPYGAYLEEGFYTDAPGRKSTVEACLSDLHRSKERHILRFRSPDRPPWDFSDLPVWSAVEAWSFGTLSKCIERGARGGLAGRVADSLGVARARFASRVKALVYLRNRCFHHNRLWHHSVVDAGATPNNVRKKAKRLAGQFEPRSVLDIVASLDDMLVRSKTVNPVLPRVCEQHDRDSTFWRGLTHPQSPRDHQP